MTEGTPFLFGIGTLESNSNKNREELQERCDE